MKLLPVLVFKRGVSFRNGCAVAPYDVDVFGAFKSQVEETSFTFTDIPAKVIVVQRDLLDLLNQEEIHAMYMHEYGHIESGHTFIETDPELSLVQEIQADAWAISVAGVKPAVLKTTLMKALVHICGGDMEIVASIEALCAPRLQFLV